MIAGAKELSLRLRSHRAVFATRNITSYRHLEQDLKRSFAVETRFRKERRSICTQRQAAKPRLTTCSTVRSLNPVCENRYVQTQTKSPFLKETKTIS